MKKSFVLALLLGIITLGHAKPQISGISFPSSVGLFDLYEISFQMGSYTNPYDPDVIDVQAVFTAPDGRTFTVNGFYYEGYTFEQHHTYQKSHPDTRSNGWKVRFTPNQTGTWHFTLRATDKKGKVNMDSYGSTPFEFRCNTVNKASGFITTANAKYLKRETVVNGKRGQRSFFPIGPNVAWYTCKSYYDFNTEYGIYEYERRIDSLAGNANYMRVFLNRPQYLSLYGAEFTQVVGGKATVYFDKTLNQKDAAEFDHIIEYAAEKGITVMPSIFCYCDLKSDPKHDNALDKYPDDWRLNPYHTILGLKSPEDFFTDTKAKRVSKNLIRYIVARWGYATNIVAWELWNEVANMDFDNKTADRYCNNVISWHDEMADYIRSNDPFNHLVTTSIGSSDPDKYLYKNAFRSLDFVQEHKYFAIQKAKSKEQSSYQLDQISVTTDALYPNKPLYIGEFGFGKQSAEGYLAKDPYGVDLHNILWSTLFSGMMGPASFWPWTALDKCGNQSAFKPVLTFCKGLPILSGSFKAHTTGNESKTAKSTLVFPNNIETYYLSNAAEDTLYGWSQDTAFAYQSLRRLTDRIGSNQHFEEGGVFDTKGYVYTLNARKRPKPSSKSNTISLPIAKQPIGTRYIVKWYDTETGLEIESERTMAAIGKDNRLSIEFPSSIRDLKRRRINNTFGDAVFVLTVDRDGIKNGGIMNNAANGEKRIRAKKGVFRQ